MNPGMPREYRLADRIKKKALESGYLQCGIIPSASFEEYQTSG
jgi:hypothetical protein